MTLKEPEKDKTKRGGRPRIEFSPGLEKEIRSLAMIQCSVEEISIVTGQSQTTLRRHFGVAIKEAREGGNNSLRRAQFKAALKGNSAMLIWLGKQWLGQKDKQDLELSGPDGGPIQTQTRELTDEMLVKHEESLKRIASRYGGTERGISSEVDETGVDQEQPDPEAA